MNYNYLYSKFNLTRTLTEKELHHYLLEYKNGNKEVKDILLKYNIRLVLNIIVKNYQYLDFDLEDLVIEGLVGLNNAIEYFDIDKNISFSTYATKCILRQIYKYIRKSRRKMEICSLDELLDEDIEVKNIYDNESLKYMVDEQLELNEEKQIIKNIIEKLPDMEKKMINLYFGIGYDKSYTQREISKILGITQSKISTQLRIILDNIKQELIKQGINGDDRILKPKKLTNK